jgi:RNA polymerase sigma-70 factor (ECF subfamily)
MARRDPLSDPEPLIKRVYSYVAYRIGPGADAEDVTSTVIERALRYRGSYDPAKGDPRGWLLGIARTCVDDHLRSRSHLPLEAADLPHGHSEESATIERVNIASVVAALDERDQDLIALRYGADLNSKEIGAVLGMTVGAVDVALHRSRGRLRAALEHAGYGASGGPPVKLRAPATEPFS